MTVKRHRTLPKWMRRLYCKVLGHDPVVEAVEYGTPTPPVGSHVEQFKIRSRWHCDFCGHEEDTMPKPGEPWFSAMATAEKFRSVQQPKEKRDV